MARPRATSWPSGDRTAITSAGWFDPFDYGTRYYNLGINLMRPWRDALRDYIVREFPLALANADPNAERRQRPERRKFNAPWTGIERRSSQERRSQRASRELKVG